MVSVTLSRKGWSILKHLRGFLERKFDSYNLYAIHKKPKSIFFFRQSVVFLPVQLESKRGHFELTNEQLLMKIKYMELLNQTLFDRHNTCSWYWCSQFSISFIDLRILPLLPIHSSNNHFGSSIFSPRCYDLSLSSLHLDS